MYCRLSRDDENEGSSYSIANQKKMLDKFAKEHKFRNPEFFVDDGYSGGDFDRPNFNRMISLVQDGKIGTIIIRDMSRFGRDYLKVGFHRGYVSRHGCALHRHWQRDQQYTISRTAILPLSSTSSTNRYLKDSSKKIRAVFKAKGEAGEHYRFAPALRVCKG